MELLVEMGEGLKLSIDEDTSIRKVEHVDTQGIVLCKSLFVYVLELNSNPKVECQTCIQCKFWYI